MNVDIFVVTLPLRIESVSNLREHWRKKHTRVQREREAVALIIRNPPPSLRAVGYTRPRVLGADDTAVVILTRIAPRQLDQHDNLRSALKGVVDQVTDELGLPNDRDLRIEFRYQQERGAPRYYGVRIEIAVTRAAPRVA